MNNNQSQEPQEPPAYVLDWAEEDIEEDNMKDTIYYADLIKEIQECLENMDGANLEELVNDHFDLGYTIEYIGDGFYKKK